MARSKVGRKLELLGRRLRNKVVRQGLRAAAKVVLKEARRRAPVRSGMTRKALRVKAQKRKVGRLGVNVQAGEGDYLGKTYYAAFIEFGTVRMKAVPFMRPAYMAKRREARRAAERTMIDKFYLELRKVK